MATILEIITKSKLAIDMTIETITKIYGILNDICKSENKEICNAICKLDINDKLKEIECFLMDLKTIHVEYFHLNSISTAIASLSNSVTDIHKCVDNVNKTITNHKNLWVNTLRSVNYANEFESLITKDAILTLRYDRLRSLLTIPWSNIKVFISKQDKCV